ncbi:MAG: hypothetical protein IPN79_07465 [Saprospiraceae bacterium]|nr:hypothetical protein [Saprospiraceae bacterium]
MKSSLKFSIFSFLILGFSFFSCGDEDLVSYKEGGVLKIADAYLDVLTPVVSFQAGTPDYTISMDIINGEKRVNKVNVYSVYTDAVSGKTSNEVLLAAIDVPAGNKVNLSKKLTYADLKNGVTVNGAGLPDDQNQLSVGSGWKLRFEGETSLGIVPLVGNINLAVLSRFAGIYKVVESHYYRIGVLTADWNGQERFIGSVDDNTFSYNDYWGNFAWAGCSFRFKIDFATNKIEVPILTSCGTFAGNRAISCPTDEALFAEFDCKTFDVFEPNEATGKHRIKLTYGYFTDGSGPRAFYEVLEKVQ